MTRTAAEVIQLIDAKKYKAKKEQTEFRKAQLQLEAYHDLRDDVMSLVKNSGLTFAEIHGRCGPHPATLEAWAQHVTDRPQLGKLRAVLRIIGYDFTIGKAGSK